MNNLGYKKEQRSVIMTIGIGSNVTTAYMDDLPSGDRVFMGAIARPIQEGLVRLSVKRNSDTIVQATDITWFDGGIGSFDKRALEISDTGNKRLDLMVETTNNVANTPLTIEVVFQVWVKC